MKGDSKIKRILYRIVIRPFIKLYNEVIRSFPKYHTHLLYKQRFGKSLNLEDPQTLNEKVLWLKFNEYSKPIYTQCADKYGVRAYVESKGCGTLLNHLHGVYDTSSEIDFSVLPNRFALKCNHAAGYNIICEDKSKLDITKACKQLDKWMKKDFSRKLSEPQYKNIARKIICEAFIDNQGEFPDDYKFYCFDGKPEVVMLCRERKSTHTKFYYLDMDWNLLPLNETSEDAIATGLEIEKPVGFESLKKYAALLSQDFPFVRADFYLVNDKPMFGELTFTPAAGLDRTDVKANILLGKMLNLSDSGK